MLRHSVCVTHTKLTSDHQSPREFKSSRDKMAFAQSKAVQGKVWKIPESAERIVLFLDPLSLLRLVPAGVLSKQVLKKSISTPVWKNLIRRGSYGEDGLQKLPLLCMYSPLLATDYSSADNINGTLCSFFQLFFELLI